MSRKMVAIGIVMFVVASTGFADISQSWNAGATNGVMQVGGAGFGLSNNGVSVSNTQGSFSWFGGALQTGNAQFSQTAIAGGLAGQQNVGQMAGGMGGQTIGLTGMSQGMTIGAGQTVGTAAGWIGGAHGTQTASASQSQGTASWAGISGQTQQANIVQSGTVVGALGGTAVIHQGAYAHSSQTQN